MKRLFASLALVVTLLGVALAGDKPMSPKERDELLRSTDPMLEFIKKDLGLAVSGPVAIEFTDREKIVERSHKDSKDQQDEMLRSELLLKKLGLIPRDYSLAEFFSESKPRLVLGYYSDEDKKLYVVETLPRGQRQAVLVHELVHAVQDQNVSIERYIQGGDKAAYKAATLVESKHDPTYDDGALARLAIVEGQAMLVMIDDVLATARNSPHDPMGGEYQILMRALEAAFPSPDKEQKGVIKQTPNYLKRLSAFPYIEGGAFIRAMQAAGGSKYAVAKVMNHPPRSTREIMMPDAFLHDEEVPRLTLPRLAPVAAPDYDLLHLETAGQFDTSMLVEQFAGEGKARRLAPKWRGGMWYEFVAPAPAGTARQTKDVALLYVSRWQDKDAAGDFADIYAKSVAKKYAAAKPLAADGAVRRWDTEEGRVSVEVAGDRVIVMESFNDSTAARLREALGKQ